MRLHQGDDAKQTTYSDNPIKQFDNYVRQGSKTTTSSRFNGGAKIPSQDKTATLLENR